MDKVTSEISMSWEAAPVPVALRCLVLLALAGLATSR
jgi:hypothetical protein